MISKPAIMRRGEYKFRILEMHLKLTVNQLKTNFYIYRPLYQNLMETINQKTTLDIHTKNKKESKHNTKHSHQITRKENKREKEEKQLTKNPKQFLKWQ